MDCGGLPRSIPSLILELIHQYWGAAEPDPVSLINNSLIPCQDSYKIKYQTVRTHGGRDQRAGILQGEELHEHESPSRAARALAPNFLHAGRFKAGCGASANGGRRKSHFLFPSATHVVHLYFILYKFLTKYPAWFIYDYWLPRSAQDPDTDRVWDMCPPCPGCSLYRVVHLVSHSHYKAHSNLNSAALMSALQNNNRI